MQGGRARYVLGDEFQVRFRLGRAVGGGRGDSERHVLMDEFQVRRKECARGLAHGAEGQDRALRVGGRAGRGTRRRKTGAKQHVAGSGCQGAASVCNLPLL